MFGHDKDEDNQNDMSAPITDAPVASDDTDELNLPGVPMPAASAVGMPNEDDAESIENDAVAPEEHVAEPTTAPSTSSPTDLSSLKQDALKELSSIIDKIELPAGEKLETILMLYESTKDKNLLKSAFDAAKSLDDDGKRAEALLDLVHKIDAV